MDRPTQGARSPSRQSLPAWINSDVSQAVSLHCPRHYLLWKYTSSGQSEHAFHSILGRKTLLQKKKIHILPRQKFFSLLAHPLCANGFFQPCIILSPEINVLFCFVFSPWEVAASVCTLLGGSEGIRGPSSRVPALTSKCAPSVGCRGRRQVAEVPNRWCSD